VEREGFISKAFSIFSSEIYFFLILKAFSVFSLFSQKHLDPKFCICYPLSCLSSFFPVGLRVDGSRLFKHDDIDPGPRETLVPGRWQNLKGSFACGIKEDLESALRP
jgi:hypothetical protein